MKKLKLNFASVFMMSLILGQAALSTTAKAENNKNWQQKFDRCGALEDKVRKVIQREVEKQGDVLKFRMRNEALLNGVVAACEKDDALAPVIKAMRGHPSIDGETRLKYSDQITTFLHDRKMNESAAFIVCPEGYEPDESKLSTGLWKPEYPPAEGHTRQGLGDTSDIPHACQPAVDPHYAPDSNVPPLESTSVSTSFGDQWYLKAKMKDPMLIAITDVDRPVTLQFRGQTMVLSRLGVMTYLHLKDGRFEHADETVFLHGVDATIGGRKVELESYIDNELLPKECKDFHSTGPVADGGGSGNGGKASAFNNQGDQTSTDQVPADAVASIGGFDNQSASGAAPAKAPSAVRPAN